MKKIIALYLLLSGISLFAGEKITLFDGKTFKGWEGDTNKTWRIEDGAIVAGNLKDNIPHNEFLCTQQSFTNFVLRLKFKVEGTKGFVNGGVQVRSQRVPNHFEVSGYQADLGEGGWWGTLYDEARRNKVLVKADPKIADIVKKNEWNDYEIRCEGDKITLLINGTKSLEYTEMDASIPRHGILGLQVHGGGVTQISYKDITLEVL